VDPDMNIAMITVWMAVVMSVIFSA